MTLILFDGLLGEDTNCEAMAGVRRTLQCCFILASSNAVVCLLIASLLPAVRRSCSLPGEAAHTDSTHQCRLARMPGGATPLHGENTGPQHIPAIERQTTFHCLLQLYSTMLLDKRE
jgi:hypothetical protein